MDFMSKSYTTEQVDEMAKDIAELRKEKDEVSKKLSDISGRLDHATGKFIEALGEIGKTNWQIPGFKMSVTEKVYPRMMKDHGSVSRLMDWLSMKGEDFYLSHVSVNAQTLGRLLRDEREQDPEAVIPGVDDTFKKKSISVRKG